MDYTRLRDLLQAGRWKDADQETSLLMYEAMGQLREGCLTIEDIQNFPCADLRTIDKLWVMYSEGRFGFSVQKEIWQKYGSPTGYTNQWEKFGEEVGWLEKKGFFLIMRDWNANWKGSDELTFDTSAPRGHLPFIQRFTRSWVLTSADYWWAEGVSVLSPDWKTLSSLASRLVDCNIC